MNSSQLRLLSRMKKLVTEGHMRFEQRKDRDYLQALLEIGITEAEAWNQILGLNKHFYFPDPKPNYMISGESLTFKRTINGYMTYIKLKIEKTDDDQDETVCISFHIDE